MCGCAASLRVAINRTLLAAALALLGATACQESTTSSLPPTSTLVVLAPFKDSTSHSITLIATDTLRLVSIATDIFQRPASARVTFTSRSTLIATVSTTGLVRALREGSTWIVGFTAGPNNTTLADSVRVAVRVICTTEARPGVTIAVQDSLTGSKGPFSAVAFVAREGTTYRDSTLVATVPAQVTGLAFLVGLAYERAGTYEVSVKATNYKLWSRSGVVVSKDACHAITVNVTARLVPQ